MVRFMVFTVDILCVKCDQTLWEVESIDESTVTTFLTDLCVHVPVLDSIVHWKDDIYIVRCKGILSYVPSGNFLAPCSIPCLKPDVYYSIPRHQHEYVLAWKLAVNHVGTHAMLLRRSHKEHAIRKMYHMDPEYAEQLCAYRD